MKELSIDKNKVLLEAFVQEIRPEELHIREQVDFGYSYEKHTAIFYEIRPNWRDKTIIMKMEFAKLRYYKSRDAWNLYWMRASGDWELYEPHPESIHLRELLLAIRNDKHGCFFG